MRARLAGAPAGGSRAGSRPPPRWWILAVPCLLTLPLSGYFVLLASVFGVTYCFDTCDPYVGRTMAVVTAEFFFGAATIVTALLGLAAPSWRRILAAISWLVCLLAYLGLVVR